MLYQNGHLGNNPVFTRFKSYSCFATGTATSEYGTTLERIG